MITAKIAMGKRADDGSRRPCYRPYAPVRLSNSTAPGIWQPRLGKETHVKGKCHMQRETGFLSITGGVILPLRFLLHNFLT